MQTDWRNESERYRFAGTEDVPKFAEMLLDPEVGRWLWFTPAPREMFEGYFTPLIDAQAAALGRGERPEAAVFTVEDSSGEFLGQGAVVPVEASPQGFEIGFQLRQQAWGRGVGTRLSAFVRAYAVHECAAYRLEAACLAGNTASRTILGRLGLNLEGERPGYRVRDGVRHTELHFGVEVARLDPKPIRRVAAQVGLLQP